MLENSTQNKKEHRLVLVVAYAEFNKNLNKNALLSVGYVHKTSPHP